MFSFGALGRKLAQVVGQASQIPDVALDFWQFYAFDRVWLQHPVYQVFYFWRDVIRQEILSFLNLLKQNRHLVIVEGQLADHHCVQNDANRPNIDIGTSVAEASNHLGCCIVGTTARSCQRLAILDVVGKAKVDHLDVIVSVEKQVFRF